ncbi:MAG: protein kinase [candidate division Zixibacteria bacterium]|nr:protein kinase [candidate division Zixibacteria bacterium]
MLTPGQDFGHFKILQKLGEGGMGEVYLAEDLKLNRRVALKTLRNDYFDNQDRRDRFEREAKTAAQISHANVMAIYDIGAATDPQSQKDIGYIVMEYVKGRTLTEYVTSSTTDTGALLRLAEKIASGLAAAHKMGIVHRDIKAENILIGEHDEPKILDFGLAKVIEPLQMEGAPASGETVKKQLTTAGTVVGTVSYMSPEQVRGEAVDNRSDIFSFGVLLFRMFTGDMPFVGSTQVSILAKILEAQHPSPHGKNENINPEIERIIDKCLQKNPNGRYQDTRDLVVDLRNLRRQYDSGVSSSTSSMTAQINSAVRTDRKKQRLNRLIRVGVVLLFFILFFGWRGFSPLKKLFSGGSGSTVQAGAYTLAILSFDNKTGDKELDWLRTGLPEILLTDLAQDQSINIVSQRRIIEELGGSGNDVSEFAYGDQVQAARKLGAVNVLSGSIFKLGSKIRIDARLEDVASGKILLAEKVVSDDPMTLVDSLATRLTSALNLRGMSLADRSVAQLTTSSPEAYRYYHLGMQKFLDQFYDEAITDLNKAVALDSTFALAYMRIGMSYMFQGRQQEGVPYFLAAKRFESHLPDKERSLLDIYTDIWVKQDFAQALAKMQALVDTYPDDQESKSVYAMLRWELVKDTAGALQLYQNVLQQDPKYQLVLGFIIQYYSVLGDFDKAIEYTKQLQRYHPESPAAARILGELSLQQGKFDEAIDAYKEVLRQYPGDADAQTSLIDCYIRLHDLAQAETSLEDFGRSHAGDPFRMAAYFRWKANLANWSGKFKTGMKYRFDVLAEAHKTKDNAQVAAALQALSQAYSSFGFIDSAVYYYTQTDRWITNFQRLNYPVGLVSIDRSYAPKVKSMQEQTIASLRTRVPANLLPVGDAVQDLFDGYANADTAKIIETMKRLIKIPGVTSSDARREIGEYCILTGRHKEGIEWILPYVSGKDQTSSGFYYPHDNYLLGIASEALGDKQAAAKYYKEMLRYWGNPEIELKEIKDAKARLARLAA